MVELNLGDHKPSDYAEKYILPQVNEIMKLIYQTWSKEERKYFYPNTGKLPDRLLKNVQNVGFIVEYSGSKIGIKLVRMSPERYLDLLVQGLNVQWEEYQGGKGITEFDKDIGINERKYNHIKELWEDDEMVPAPILFYHTTTPGHEGRHRAKVAYDLGIEKIPVYMTWKIGDMPDIKEIERLMDVSPL